MLEWKPRLVLLVLVLPTLAAMLAWTRFLPRNYGW